MKKFFKMFGVVGLLAGMMMVSGCGDDATSQGRVVKGPVSGAKVTDSLGAVLTSATTNGYFNLGGTAPYTSNGGTYFALNTAGTAYDTTTSVNAPPLTAPAGTTQLTPLSTVFAYATSAQQTSILAALTAAGLTLNSNMAPENKTAATATLIILNETIGAVLAKFVNTTGFTPTLAALNNAAAALASAVVTAVGTNVGASTVTSATITTAVQSATTAALAAAIVGATGAANAPTVATLNAAAAAAATSANAVSITTPISAATTTPTGSTGASGSTGTILK